MCVSTKSKNKCIPTIFLCAKLGIERKIPQSWLAMGIRMVTMRNTRVATLLLCKTIPRFWLILIFFFMSIGSPSKNQVAIWWFLTTKKNAMVDIKHSWVHMSFNYHMHFPYNSTRCTCGHASPLFTSHIYPPLDIMHSWAHKSPDYHSHFPCNLTKHTCGPTSPLFISCIYPPLNTTHLWAHKSPNYHSHFVQHFPHN